MRGIALHIMPHAYVFSKHRHSLFTDRVKNSIVNGNLCNTILPTKTAAQNEAALSYHRLRGLYFLAVVFVRSIVLAIDRPVHRQSPVVHYWTASEIKYNMNCCLCQFSNDSDYVFNIIIIDITELLSHY